MKKKSPGFIERELREQKLEEFKRAVVAKQVGDSGGQVFGAIVGGIVGVALAPFTGGASVFWSMATLGAVLGGMSIGAAIGGLIDPPRPPEMGRDFSSKSPTYGFQALYNTTSNQHPIGILYGKMKLAGNHIWMSAPGTTLHKFIAVCEGEINSVANVKVNDIAIGELTGCSYDFYAGTSTQTVDARASGAVDGLRYTAYLAVTLVSGDKLKGGNPTVTAEYEGLKIATWSGSSFTGTTYSNNPAACIRDFLTNTRYGVGLPTSAIDNATFGSVSDYCDALVDKVDFSGQEKRYTLNMIIDGRQPALDVLQAMLACFGGYLILSGNKIKLGLERASATIQSFTMDSVVVGSFGYHKAAKDEIPNRVKVQYVDSDYNWIKIYALAENKPDQDERSALQLGEKIIEKEFSCVGITSFSQASRLSNLYLYLGFICPTYISFKTSLRGLVCEVGDVISISHDVPNWTAKLFRILQMRFAEDDNIEIIAREYNASLYTDKPGQAIQMPDYGSAPNEFEALNAPSAVTITESGYLNTDGTWIPTISASWTDTQDKTFFAHYIVDWKRGGGAYSTYSNTTATSLELSPLQVGVTYIVQVKTVNTVGLVSSAATSNTLTIAGRSTLPGNITTLTNTFEKELTLRWSSVTDHDLDGYELRTVDDYWGGGSGLTWRGVSTEWTDPTPSGTDITYYAKAFNRSGNYSATAVSTHCVNEVPLDITGFTGTHDANISLQWNDMDVENDLSHYEVRTTDASWGVSGTSNLTFQGYATHADNIDPSGTRAKAFYIKGFDVHGQESASAATFTASNNAPSTPTLSVSTFFNIARFSWTDVYDLDLKYYELWESATNAWGGEESVVARLQSTEYENVSSGLTEGTTTTDSTKSTIYLSGTEISSTDDAYNSDTIYVQSSGTAWEESTITDYDGSGQYATISPALTYTPDVGDNFHIDDVSYYKVGGVDNYGSGTLSSAVTVAYTQLSGSIIADEVIAARKIFAGEIITNSAQIKDAVITSAHISELNANKINTGNLTVAMGLGSEATIKTTSTITPDYPYIQLDAGGLQLKDSSPGGTYGTALYGTDQYGFGSLAWLLNSSLGIPLAILKEPQVSGVAVADLRLYNRSFPPSGTSMVGDIAVVNDTLKICTSAGSPGTYTDVAAGGGANTDLNNLASVAINTSLISDADDTDDLGSASNEWRNLYIDGTANIDSLIANTADINGGTLSDFVIDGNWTAASQTCADLGGITTCDMNGGTLAGFTIDGNWTAVSQTCTDLGSVTTCDINGGTMNDVTISIGDDQDTTFGGITRLTWETADANANCLVLALPEGGVTDVPVFVIGDTSVYGVDLTKFHGTTSPTLALFSANAGARTTLRHDGTNAVLYSSSGDIVLHPVGNNVVANVNNDVDLGSAAVTWKDVYLTGDVIAGGNTGATGWFDDGTNFRITVTGGVITTIGDSVAGGHS